MLDWSSILINSINMTSWLGRDETLAALGIRPQSLYAYVSRGLIAARPDPADPRRSLYSADDAGALAGRRARGRRARDVARGTIAWGEAIMPTAVSTIAGGRPFYRTKDAVRLSDHARLEDVAALLWDADPAMIDAARGQPARASGQPVTAAMAMLAEAAATGMPTPGRTRAALAAEAAGLLKSVAGALGAEGDGDIAGGFARAWGCDADGADLLRRALVLLADHELNASTFAARVAASTGAPLAAALLAGFATLTGPVHGGAAAGLAALRDEAGRLGTETALRNRLGGGLPGFGHQLYAGIDPRAQALLAHLQPSPLLAEIADAVGRVAGLSPNIDFALLALAERLGLPADAPFRLFAAGRSCGWLAHAMEQAQGGGLIRPRASYAGPPLETGES